MVYAAGAPEDSVQTPDSFIRGSEKMAQIAEEIGEKTYHQVCYLGEWHTHPNMSNEQSSTDKTQFEVMSTSLNHEDMPFVQAILGENGLNICASM